MKRRVTVKSLIGDFDREKEEIAALKREGERRIALIEKDMRQRLNDEVEALETRLKESRPQLCKYIADAAPLVHSVDTTLEDPILNRFLDETASFDQLAQMVDGVIHESWQDRPLLPLPEPLQILQPWTPEWIIDKEFLIPKPENGCSWTRSIILRSAPNHWHPVFEMVFERINSREGASEVSMSLINGPEKLTDLEFVFEEVADAKESVQPGRSLFRHTFVLTDEWLRGQSKDPLVPWQSFRWNNYFVRFHLKVRPLNYGVLKKLESKRGRSVAVDVEEDAEETGLRKYEESPSQHDQVKVDQPDGVDDESGQEVSSDTGISHDPALKAGSSGQSTSLSLGGIASLEKANELLNQKIMFNRRWGGNVDDISTDEEEEEDVEPLRQVEILEESGGVDASNPLQRKLVELRGEHYRKLLRKNEALTRQLAKSQRPKKMKMSQLTTAVSDTSSPPSKITIEEGAPSPSPSSPFNSSLFSYVPSRGVNTSTPKTKKCPCGGQYSPSYFRTHQTKHCKIAAYYAERELEPKDKGPNNYNFF